MDANLKSNVKLSKLDKKSIEQLYTEKYNYIHEIVKFFPSKNAEDEDVEMNVLKERQVDPNHLPERLYPGAYNDKKRAKTIEDLQSRIAALKGKTKLSYKEKVSKKNLKNRLKKKDKKERRKQARSASKALANFERKKARIEAKPPKPVFNNGQMIFSKFDFSEMGVKKAPYKNTTKDPVVALRKMKEEDEKLKTLKEEGETELVNKIVEKKAWKNALLKSEGVAVKDDPDLLVKAIRKKKNLKERSIKKWEEREKKLSNFKEQKQRKRMENIQKKVESKKMVQMKKAAKRGRVGKLVAGF